MPDPIDFYFDFVSPFSYLAHHRVPDLARRFGRTLVYRVVELAVIKREGGNTGPTTREMPLKYRYSGIDMQRWARRYGVTIRRPSGYGSARLNKGVFYAEDKGRVDDYVAAAWQRVWGEGGNMADETLIHDVAVELGWEGGDFLDFTLSRQAEDRYLASTLAAHHRGVFGVPTVMIGDEMFWGNDRLDFAEEFLAVRP